MGRRVLLAATAVAAALACASAVAAAPSKHALNGLAAAQWKTWWGLASFSGGAATLQSATPSSPAETHSALITSRQAWSDPTISFTTTTLRQLRTGSSPNPWEVGWVMFRFHDLANYYWFLLKPNGFELGKKQGSQTQIFLDTGPLPGLQVGRPRHIEVLARGSRIRVLVDGTQVVDYTDPSPLLGAGSVGLYEEDSQVRFDSVAIR